MALKTSHYLSSLSDERASFSKCLFQQMHHEHIQSDNGGKMGDKGEIITVPIWNREFNLEITILPR